MLYKFKFILLALIFFSICADYSAAEIYKYKDENGVWHFTDTPHELHQGGESLDGIIEKKEIDKDIHKLLSEKLPQRTKIERAICATVAIKTSLGHGTGFFITDDGFILTNKHVVKGDAGQFKKNEKNIEITNAKVKEIGKKIKKERADLKAAKENLNQFKQILEKQSSSSIKRINEQQYENNLKRYKAWEKDFKIRKKKFRQWKKKTNKIIDDYKYKKTISDLSRTFKIFLADNTEIDAALVLISKKHDLALLKIDGYKTPFLKSANPFQFPPGKSVYAIGNPIRLRNSVAKGIISGFENNFIKTDAKIYPGNSGGPLVTKNGIVIGINTFKKLTKNYEGLGFAISIKTALDEFKTPLNN